MATATGIVERYLDALTRHDWSTFTDCLADDFTRVGPYGDTYSSKSEYVAFIADLLPKLPGYAMEIKRVTYGDGVAFAELIETVTVDGAPLRTPEVIVLTIDGDDHVARIEVFIQTTPPVRNPLDS